MPSRVIRRGVYKLGPTGRPSRSAGGKKKMVWTSCRRRLSRRCGDGASSTHVRVTCSTGVSATRKPAPLPSHNARWELGAAVWTTPCGLVTKSSQMPVTHETDSLLLLLLFFFNPFFFFQLLDLCSCENGSSSFFAHFKCFLQTHVSDSDANYQLMD